MSSQSIALTDSIYRSFQASKKFTFKDQQTITSLDYDDSGQFLISTSANETIELFDAMKGKPLKTIGSKKYGCHLAKFTHNSKTCIYASTKLDHTIRYLQFKDNSFLRYFKGHTAQVTSLEVSPTHDIFLTSSLDDTIRLWDVRASNQQALRPFKSPGIVSYDPSGLVVCISSLQNSKAQLYDVRSLENDPFQEFSLPVGFQWNKVEFSNDNKYILFSCTNGNHLIFDSFDCDIVAELSGMVAIPPSDFPYTGSASFTPDGKFVFSGNGNGTVSVWDLSNINGKGVTIQPICHLSGDNRPRNLIFNPKYLQFATADEELFFWLPDSV
ncbi:hypothetical protein WICMUC_001510 [Wickerhamomyces mucosus]|uniref:Anaphase-promoting complex subunit 4 WD40 domain-containing protein n=1 Tax=Wickerhamomyces mucosus TaxID=1378264 RepID=A0A9P8PU73_9ASCO|nr:hypothetical protein WICMUC_001510 [Wickerhamomyces mucosus]